MKAGFILNLNSTGGRSAWRRRRLVESASKLGALVKETSSVEEMKRAVEEFAEKEVELLLPAGGDGTLQNLVTYLKRDMHDEYRPIILPVPTGASNVTVKNLGMDARALWLMWLLRRKLRKGEFMTREVATLKVTDGETGVENYGFIFVSGTPYRLTLRYKEMRPGMASVVRVTSSAISEFVTYVLTQRRKRPDFIERIEVDASIDGSRYPYDRAIIVLASVLPNPILSFTPFYGCDGIPKGGRFYLLINSMDDREIAYNLFSILTGRYKGGRAYNGEARLLDVKFNDGYAIDGEIFNEGGESSVRVEPGSPVRVLLFRDEKLPSGENM